MGTKGCNNCRHYDMGKMSFGGTDGLEIISGKRSCKIGKNDDLNNWWVENGRKTSDTSTDMVCFEETESARMLNKMSSLLDEIKIELKKSHEKS